MTRSRFDGLGRPSRRQVIAISLGAAAYLAVGIVAGWNRYAVLVALLAGRTEPAESYRVIFLCATATLVIFAGTLVLHLFTRAWWSTALLLASVGTMVAAVCLNLPPQRAQFRARREFLEQFGGVVGDPALARAVFDASVTATVTIVIGALLTTAWAFGLRHYRSWTLARGSGALERFVFRAAPFVMWLYPFALVGVLALIARIGAPIPTN